MKFKMSAVAVSYRRHALDTAESPLYEYPASHPVTGTASIWCLTPPLHVFSTTAMESK